MTSYKASSTQRINRQVPVWTNKPTKRPLFQDPASPPKHSTSRGPASSVNRNWALLKDRIGLNTDSWTIWAAIVATASVTIGTAVIGLLWGIDSGLRNLLLCEIVLGAFLLSMLAILSRIDYLEACRAYRANQESINPSPQQHLNDHIYDQSGPAHTPITIEDSDSILNCEISCDTESGNTWGSSDHSLSKRTKKALKYMRKPFELD